MEKIIVFKNPMITITCPFCENTIRAEIDLQGSECYEEECDCGATIQVESDCAVDITARKVVR